MPKWSQKVRSAIENLGSQAKKRKISVDKENSHPVDIASSSVVASGCETTFPFNSTPSKSKLPVEIVLSASGQVFVQLKNNGAAMDSERSHTAAMVSERSHTTAMDSEHNHTATMDSEHSTHLQVNANLSEESSLALQDSVDMDLEYSDVAESECESNLDLDCRDHESVTWDRLKALRISMSTQPQ
ncbi:uncharacterized protein F5891DRAFT_1190967 [Suillus fuscotomentosus]|uniref:Uncharacterized protein n=1 Tax=Suillus fuscotomentosus TaxID=1912939 RepID=A0AAD4E210_9AGAM|nr:uncharacterized protein F5891DRAFT_1190967 [Suillus fuscotomentosus]KAG1898298.1 hypothetical protein F5891DRAFT_1190967 [Suillus fuscotomentosus]